MGVKIQKPSAVLIDNSTIVGVANLIADPKRYLTPFTLLDLESFCEAFLLFDRINSLYGQSSRLLESSLNCTDLKGIKDLLETMKTTGIFSTKDLRSRGEINGVLLNQLMQNTGLTIEDFSGYWEFLENNKRKDDILDMFSDRVPRHVLATRFQTITSNLFYRTAVYVYTSMYEGTPYFATSLRVPFAQKIIKQVNCKSESIVKKCLKSCESKMQNNIEEILREFPKQDFRLTLPPLLKLVLEECCCAKDIFGVLAKLRERKDIKEFRNWHQRFQQNLDKGCIKDVVRDLRSLKTLENESVIDQNKIITNIQSVLSLSVEPVKSILELVKNNFDLFASWIKNRHFIFLRELSNSVQTIENNSKLITSIFNNSLSEEDLNIYKKMRELEHF